MASSKDYVENIEQYRIKEVPNFPMYYATECGRVISKRRGRLKFIKGKLDKDGYRILILRVSGKNYYKRLHRIIAETFLLCEDNSYVVAHIDGNINNNCKDNLKFCTQKENIADKILHGTMPLGENVHSSKITSNTAKSIKDLLKSGNFTAVKIAEMLNVEKHIVYSIKYGKTWNHIGDK